MSCVDATSERMLAHITEFSETERRFRRYRCLLVAFLVCIKLALLVYLLLTWELSEEHEDDEHVEKDSITFTTILTVSICTLAGVSIASFIALEIFRRKTIRQLLANHNEEMRRYFAGRGSMHGTTHIQPTAPSISDHSYSVGYPPGSEASSPPPAYDDCVERR